MGISKKKFDAPTTLDDALDAISAFQRQIDDLEEQVESIGEDCSSAEDEASKAKARVEEVETEMEEHCDELSRIRQKLKAGRIDDAIYDLDKILQTIDPTAKSFTAVPVML